MVTELRHWFVASRSLPRQPELLSHPVGREPAPPPRPVVGDVIAIFDVERLDGPGGLVREALCVTPVHQPILLAHQNEERAVDLARNPILEGQGSAVRFRLLLSRTMTSDAKGFARKFGQVVPDIMEVVGAGKTDASADALLKSSGARRQIAAHKGAAIGNLDSLPRRTQMRQCELLAFDGFRVCRSHLCHVVHKHELGEVIVDGGAREMLARAQVVTVLQSGTPEILVISGAQGPCGAPVFPAFDLAGYLLEIRQQHAVRDEAGRPVIYRRFHSRVSAHQKSSGYEATASWRRVFPNVWRFWRFESNCLLWIDNLQA